MAVGLGTEWSNRTLAIHLRRYRISSDVALESLVSPIETLRSCVHTPSVLRMANMFKVVRQDYGIAGVVIKPGTSFKS